MNRTPESNRKTIGLFGAMNSGKSSLLNALVGERVSIVSDVCGTTTDPVFKAMELVPAGAVLFIDSAGVDDSGEVGMMRRERTMGLIKRCDLALLLVDSSEGIKQSDRELIELFSQEKLDYVLIFSKMDSVSVDRAKELEVEYPEATFLTSSNAESVDGLKEVIIKKILGQTKEVGLLEGLLNKGDTLVMVAPIDSEAPKGRLILPQAQLIREALDRGVRCMVVAPMELASTLSDLPKVDLVVTDSQVFAEVNSIVDGRVALTSFSILFARQKGDLRLLIDGAKMIERLTDSSRILIAESCSHNRTHEDIGRVKIPNALRRRIGENVHIEFVSGKVFADDLSVYDLVIHCGGCMLTRRHMLSRLRASQEQSVAITNYGVVLAQLSGILDIATAPLLHSDGEEEQL
ncbi:MAG: [FeFe] hydrogenase H-cluster maturation GTPase HydF [Bacteroidales bacterium]